MQSDTKYSKIDIKAISKLLVSVLVPWITGTYEVARIRRRDLEMKSYLQTLYAKKVLNERKRKHKGINGHT